MLTFVAIIHIFIAIGICIFVLLQDSKGGAMGAMGVGGSNSLLGSTGASNLLVKITRWLGVAFAITCVSLVMMTKKDSSSVLDEGIAAPGAGPAPIEQPIDTEGVSGSQSAEPSAPAKEE